MSDADVLRTERVVHAPQDDVFRAWTEIDRLRTWWGRPGLPVSRLEGELRPGGRYTIAMREPTGGERVLEWTFREIDAPRRLAYDWRWLSGSGDDSLVVVEFVDLGNSTRVIVQHSGLPPESRDAHARGWVGCLEALAGDSKLYGLLSSMTDTGTIEQAVTVAAPREQVFRALTDADELKRWWITDGSSEPRTGGRSRYEWRMADPSRDHVQEGAYDEVVHGERVAYPWSAGAAGDTRVTFALADRDGATEVALTHTGFATTPCSRAGPTTAARWGS